jgi:hypothetical protein
MGAAAAALAVQRRTCSLKAVSWIGSRRSEVTVNRMIRPGDSIPIMVTLPPSGVALLAPRDTRPTDAHGSRLCSPCCSPLISMPL